MALTGRGARCPRGDCGGEDSIVGDCGSVYQQRKVGVCAVASCVMQKQSQTEADQRDGGKPLGAPLEAAGSLPAVSPLLAAGCLTGWVVGCEVYIRVEGGAYRSPGAPIAGRLCFEFGQLENPECVARARVGAGRKGASPERRDRVSSCAVCVCPGEKSGKIPWGRSR